MLSNTYREDFVRGYIECLIWQSTDFDGEPLDSIGYTIDDISEKDRNAIDSEIADFLSGLAGDILASLSPTYSAEMAGSDFCLSRNRHGAGFWDRGLGEAGDRLHALAVAYGPQSCYPATEDHSGGLILGD